MEISLRRSWRYILAVQLWFPGTDAQPHVQRDAWSPTLQPLQPGESFQVAASVRVNSDPRPAPVASPPPPVSTSFERDMNAFAQAMYGHLGVIQISCPGGLNTLVVCGETRQDFDSFMQAWDLYADWESRLPVTPPTPTSAWRRDGTSYYRAYMLSGPPFSVTFNEGFVIIGW